MLDPYGPLFYTLISHWVFHISRIGCHNPGHNIMCRSDHPLIVRRTLPHAADCHKNTGPYPTMSFYRSTCALHRSL